MIKVNIPNFRYGEATILENINSTFETAKTHGIVGLNGAGKTTFFGLLSGFLKQNDCAITRNEKRLLRKEIAYLDTDLFFYKKITAKEFLSVFPKNSAGYNEGKLAELFRLPLDMFIEEYSTGMKKKLLLLSQVKQDKDIYILDEPFNGLDLETNKILETIIKILNQKGKTVFISTHILEPLINICHEIHFIKNRTIHKTYTKSEFANIEHDLFGEYSEKVARELNSLL